VKCSNKAFCLLTIMVLTVFLCACSEDEYAMAYGQHPLENYHISTETSQMQMDLFASDLCAINGDNTADCTIDTVNLYSAGVFDVNDREVLYAYSVNNQVNPASLTKIMTALLVMENCDLDEVITIGDVTIYEDGIQLFNLREGDRISVRDLLYITLVYSGNDAALALAQHIAGDQDAFAEMMNARALELGATNTNFVNPHGLSHENHYTTAYDLYLIFQQAVQYDLFLEIINTTSYTVNYTTAEGEATSRTISTTNRYLTGDYDFPNQIAIVGGKTGSTMAAGKCIILYANDSAGNPYICVVMGANDEVALYGTMTALCEEAIK